MVLSRTFCSQVLEEKIETILTAIHGSLSEQQGLLAGTEENWSSGLNLEASAYAVGPIPVQLLFQTDFRVRK